MIQNHYNVLQVSERASEKVIHAAYRALALLYSNDESKLKAINAAKEILLDAKLRDEYDRSRKVKIKQIGQYKIIKKIAEGGFGTTYYGEHIVLGTPVCIKHANSVSPADEAIMFDEAKSIWDLRHFGLPAIRDVIRMEDGSICLVMSYIPGPTLHHILEKTNKPLDAEHVAWIADRVLNALKYMHYNATVHGDVKPHNIIIQPDKHQVVLVDFGLSLVKPTKDTLNKGFTPFYAAPEQIAGDGVIPETDFFGLGVSMIFALGGDIENKSVPSSTPKPMCDFIRRIIAYDVLARPNWQKEDLCETIQKVREDSFGRRYSNMKPLTF